VCQGALASLVSSASYFLQTSYQNLKIYFGYMQLIMYILSKVSISFARMSKMKMICFTTKAFPGIAVSAYRQILWVSQVVGLRIQLVLFSIYRSVIQGNGDVIFNIQLRDTGDVLLFFIGISEIRICYPQFINSSKIQVMLGRYTVNMIQQL
jgi:hypothetical protein